MVTPGPSERRTLPVTHMSGRAPIRAPAGPTVLRDRIAGLAHRHRRYGAGMIYLKLHQEGWRQPQAGR